MTLAVLCLSLLVVVVDNTIVNVALPTLARDLSAGTSELQWIVDAYALVFAGLLLTGGSLGDRRGRKGALTAGLLIFAAASAAGALATTSGQLIAARAVMGIGAALVMPATLVDPDQRVHRSQGAGQGDRRVVGGGGHRHRAWARSAAVCCWRTSRGARSSWSTSPSSPSPSASASGTCPPPATRRPRSWTWAEPSCR